MCPNIIGYQIKLILHSLMQRVLPMRLILENGMVLRDNHLEPKGHHRRGCFQYCNGRLSRKFNRPSFKGQILLLTYPIIGNYGVPANSKTNGVSDFLNPTVYMHLVGCARLYPQYSHWNAVDSLATGLKMKMCQGFCIDTRN